MRKPVLLGIPALACATSCVPADRPPALARTHPVAARPIADDRLLLTRLALSVPADLRPAAPVAAMPGGAPPFVAGAQQVDDAARAAECLTAAVYYEARSEPVDGQRAVAQVVLNRVRDRAFPNSVCGVVYQGSHRSTGCQFSFTCDGSMNRPRDLAAWDRARLVAETALAGAVYAPVGAATSYHANYVSPWWAPSLSRIAAIGSHIFYRWRDAMEGALTFRQAYAGREPDVAAAGAQVALHVGDDPVDAVTVHRGAVVPPAADAMPVAAVPLRTPRLMTVSGVRVHRGLDPHADEDVSIEAETTT